MSTETDLATLQTDAFIKVSPVDLVFRRKTKVSDGKGGTKSAAETDVDAQTVRVVGVSNGRPPITIDGRQLTINKNVVGMPGLDIELGDLFEYEDRLFEVVTVERDPSWRVVAGAVRRGVA